MAGIGFEPVGMFGQGFAVQNEQFAILDTYATAIFQNDFVVMGADGTVKIATEAAIDGGDAIGSFQGCEYTNTDGQRVWSANYTASTVSHGSVAYITAHPLTKYRVKILNAGTDATTTQASVGACTNIDVTNSGSTQSGLSAQGLDIADLSASAENFRIIGLTNSVNPPLDEQAWDTTTKAAATTFTHAIVVVNPEVHFLTGAAGI
jgi:hypothetical protein